MKTIRVVAAIIKAQDDMGNHMIFTIIIAARFGF